MRRLGIPNVRVLHGDGTLGYPEAAPYDVILCAAANPVVPAAWFQQLGPGGRIIIAPNFDPRVAAEARRLSLAYCPGVGTVSEAFAALEAGAAALKLFPAEMIPPAAVRAMRAVLPREARLLPVGGIDPSTMAGYVRAGANGFGLGSALYKPGQDAAATGRRAQDFMAAWQALGDPT